MKKFIVFTTIIQILKWLSISIFFIAEEPSLEFFLAANVIEYLVNLTFALGHYHRRILYCAIISIAIMRTAVPVWIIGQNFSWKRYLKFKKPRIL